jgi:hypothetical protein
MAEGDSYCAIEDVERWTQIGAYGAGTKPTSTQVLAFQQGRAAELYGILAETMGGDAPGPANFSTTVDTSSDAGAALSAVLVMYNAIGAAMDALQAAGAGDTPTRSERIGELFVLWEQRKEALTSAARAYQGRGGTRSATHKTRGEVTSRSVTSREEDDFRFNQDTKW